MFRKVLLTLIAVLFVTHLFSFYSDDFILGAYTYLLYNTNNIDTCMDYLSEAHYNSHVCNNCIEDNTILYEKSDSRNLDMILGDFYWNEGSDVYGVYELTRANNYIYEAEYSGIDEHIYPEPCPSQFYYRMTREENVGGRNNEYDPVHSHGFAWICNVDDHIEGIAADTLYWKWLKYGDDYSLERHIILRKQETLFYNFSMKVNDPIPGNNTEVCSVNVYVLNDSLEKEYLPIYSFQPNLYENQILTVDDFYNAQQHPQYSTYKVFTFYTPIDSIPEGLIDQRTSVDKLKNFNFEVYWYDNEDLYIDYFRIYDDIYKKLENGDYDNSIIARFNALDVPNLKFLYSKDEPYPPHLDSYKLAEDALNNSIDLMTAVHRIGNWAGEDYTDYKYNHHELFNTVSEPENIIFDIYPCTRRLKWNGVHSDSMTYIQCTSDRMLNWYNNVREIAADEVIPFLTIPQTYGRWYLVPDEYNENWRYTMRPTIEMQKCLQYLPLCYDADGIIDYKFISQYHYNSRENEPEYSEPVDSGIEDYDENPEEFHRLALIDKAGDENSGNPIRTDQYYAIQESNQKIEVYGPIIKSLDWHGVGTIQTENTDIEFDVTIADNLTSITIEDDDSDYWGYVECAVYKDGNTNDNYFMLVNRRTNFSKPEYTDEYGKAVQVPRDVDSAFETANSQTIIFLFNSLEEETYLIDQYTGNCWPANGNEIQVVIEPGDGMLLKLCQLPVPEIIDGTLAISNVYIPYSLTIVSEGNLYIGDNVVFGPYADVTVQEGGNLYIYSDTYFGTNSDVKVYGILKINYESLAPITVTAKYDKWQGIDCFEGGQVWVENEAIIEKAETGIFCDGGEVHVLNSEINLCERGIIIYDNSSLDFISSDILVPVDEQACGISIDNMFSECNINIGGTEADSVYIHGDSVNQLGAGILIYSGTDIEENSFLCNYTEFRNLEVGIQHLPYCRTDHEIENCKFENCDIGVQLFGTGSIKKLNLCEFIDNDDSGIDQNTVAATVTNCEFINNLIGIEYNNTSQHGEPDIGGVTGSNFSPGGIAIRCADSSPRIKSCTFETLKGIESADDSKVNISYNASNVFHSTFAHLVFDPVHSNLSSEISMLEGHNNFFDSATFGDLLFSSDYDGRGIEINANYNAWEDYEATDSTLTGGTPPDTIITEFMDDWFGSISGSPPGNRFETASVEESQGNYVSALITFKTILNDKLESEKKFWKMSIDKVFNLTLILEEDINALLNYYEVLYQSTPAFLTEAERISLQKILKNYQKKCFVQMHEYQFAADIVVERINNPVSVLDSLFAVMQLESIYMLSYNDSTSRSSCVQTNYDRLAPKSLKDHNQKHKNHWDEIYALLGIGGNIEDEPNQNLPLIPTLFGNYPNPFNPSTTIQFSIPKESKVDITMYNIKGQKVKTIAKDVFEKGFHKLIWNGKDSFGKEVGSGVYFYKLKVNGKDKSVKKCLLLK